MPGAVAMAGRKLVPRPMQRRSLPSCVAIRNSWTAARDLRLVKGMGGAVGQRRARTVSADLDVVPVGGGALANSSWARGRARAQRSSAR